MMSRSNFLVGSKVLADLLMHAGSAALGRSNTILSSCSVRSGVWYRLPSRNTVMLSVNVALRLCESSRFAMEVKTRSASWNVGQLSHVKIAVSSLYACESILDYHFYFVLSSCQNRLKPQTICYPLSSHVHSTADTI